MPSLKFRLILVCLVLLVSACSPGNSSRDSSSSSSSGDQPWSGKSLDDWKIVFAEMQEVLDLADDEEQRLQATFEEHVEKLQAWYREHGPSIAKGDREAMQAAKNKDLATLRKIKDETGPRKQQAMAMHKQMDTDVRNALSDTNRIHWLGHRLSTRFFALAEPLELTDEQQTQIRELAIEAAKRVDNHATPQSAGLVELEKKVEAKTLNKDQRTQYDEIKDNNKLRNAENLLVVSTINQV